LKSFITELDKKDMWEELVKASEHIKEVYGEYAIKNGGITLKPINMKIPLSIAQKLDDSGQLNPQFLNSFIDTFITIGYDSLKEPITEFAFNYTFKVEEELLKRVKLEANQAGLPINEYLGRLLVRYYK
jgi:predicted DNA binding CopG/RHH family protein